MTIDLLLLLIALGLMMVTVILRKPVVLLALLTVAQWYLGQQLLAQTAIQTSSELMQVGLEVGLRLSLPLLGLLLLKRQISRPGALQILLIVVWAIVFGSLLMQLLMPVVPFDGGYFFNLMQAYRLELFAAIVGLSFACSVGARRKRK